MATMTSDYSSVVIPLVRLSDVRNSTADLFFGTIYIKRFNESGDLCAMIDIMCNDPYSLSFQPRFDYRLQSFTGNNLFIKPCKFKYNNTWYGGLCVSTPGAGVHMNIHAGYINSSIIISLLRSNNLFILYKKTNDGEIVNQEIYDSISFSDNVMKNPTVEINGEEYSNSLHYIPFSGNTYKNIIVARKTEQSNMYFIYYTLTWDVGPVNSASCAYVIYSGSSTLQTDFYYYKLYGRMPDEDIIIEKIKLEGEQTYKIHIKYSGGYPGTYGCHILPLYNSNDYLITTTDI